MDGLLKSRKKDKTKMEKEKTIKCPFCSEKIEVKAQKCRFCGEWLNKPTERLGGTIGEKGSVEARAVSRGIKQKELDDYTIGCFGVLAMIIAIIVGIYIHWILSIIVIVLALFWTNKWYYKE